MTETYTPPTISNFNDNAPDDDGTVGVSNLVKWQKHIDEIGTPLKDYADAINSATETAFDNILANNVPISVTDPQYGADNTGVSDASSAIQSAINAANTAGGGIVYFPIGTYLINSTLNLDGKDGVVLLGAGYKYDSAIIKWNGAANGTMVTMEGTRYCKIENLNFDCDSSADIAINHYWDGTGSSSYECTFQGVFVQNALDTGIIIGNANNYQTSEAALYDVIVYGCDVGVKLLGQNTQNVKTRGLKLEENATGLHIAGANIIAFDSLFLVNSTRDIYIGSNEAPNVFWGGYSEQSEQFVYFEATGANQSTAFIGISVSADDSGTQNLMVQDSSLHNVTWMNCTFKEDCGCHLAGFAPLVQNYGSKRFINCSWTTGSGVAQVHTTPIITTNTPLTNCIVEADAQHTKANTFIDGDATPSVLGINVWETANTTPTTITALDNGSYGQRVTIMFGDTNTTIDFTGTTLTGNVGVDWTPDDGDHMVCVFDGTNWRCAISDNTA